MMACCGNAEGVRTGLACAWPSFRVQYGHLAEGQSQRTVVDRHPPERLVKRGWKGRAMASTGCHPWDVSPAEAVCIQQALRDRVVVRPLERPPCTIGGLDVHGDWGAVAVLSFPDLCWLGGAVARCPTSFPYIPGLLAFRELPVLLAAIARLGCVPDLFLCDGQGLAHPRRFGIACHLGVRIGRPSVGCAKSWLRGAGVTPDHEAESRLEPGPQRGQAADLMDGPEVVGAVLRTQANVRPVYVSVGHLIDLTDALRVVLECAPRYRLPEPLRMAHRMARDASCRAAPRASLQTDIS